MLRRLTSTKTSIRGDAGDHIAVTPRDTCIACSESLEDSELYATHRVCPNCRFHYSMGARERIASLADRGTFRETNRSVVSLDPLSFSTRVSYKLRLFQDQRRTGLTEAVVTGSCSIGASPAVLIVLDFGFMGGSMGSVVGEKVALAFEHASKRKLPVVAVVTSGGARIQEGMLSLMQMAKTTIAASRLSEKGLPFICVLANPTTGQVYASFANMADVLLAEPGAIVGFAPLRYVKRSTGRPMPRGSHTSEGHLEHGLLDKVVDRTNLRDVLAILLDLLGTRYRLDPQTQPPRDGGPHPEPTGAWDSVQLARHESRPTTLDYLDRMCTSFVELHGDRVYGDDRSMVTGIAHLSGQTVVVIGQERDRRGEEGDADAEGATPEGLRKAQRAIALAVKFDLPLLTLIDTPGPATSLDAEQRGIGAEIASTMSALEGCAAPSIGVVIGEGGGESALALAVTDRVLMLEHAIYSVVSPEEAAGLIYQDAGRAEEVAESLKLTSEDCRELGIVDEVVQEPLGGAHTSPDEAARQLRSAVLRNLAELQRMSGKRRLSQRYKKFRNVGRYSSRVRAAVAREVNSLQGLVATRVKRIARRQRSGESDEGEVETPIG